MPNLGNTTRPAYVYDAETDTWLPIGVGAHSHDQIPASIVDAKGDLIVGTAADTVQKRTVGADGSYLVADSTQTTGLNWAGPSNIAGKNSIINGGFDIWQRGTSFVPTTTAFGPDRWQIYRNTTGSTASRQTPGATLPQFQYCARMQRDSGTTAINSASYAMTLETSESLKYAGQNVTLSFYARAGANFSGSGASSMRIYLMYGSGTDQNEISGFTGNTFLVNGTTNGLLPITTSWVRYSFTVAIPSTATQLGLELNALWSGTAGAADYFEVAGVQLELGTTATTFSRAGGTIQGELAACQRYYQRFTAGSANNYMASGGIAGSSTDLYMPVKLTTTMRIAPTAIDYTGLRWQIISNSGTISSAVISDANPNMCLIRCTSTGLTSTTQSYMLMTAANTDYLGFSAEL